jgi:hypothetical protein
MPLEANRDQIEIFVEALFRHATSGDISLRSFYDDGGNRSFQIVPFALNGHQLNGLIDIAEKMAGQAANAVERVVFCPPIATFHNGRNAIEKDVTQGPVLSVELDTDPQRARTKLEQILGPATLVVRSGGRWTDPQTGLQHDKLHVHWRLNKPATGEQLTLLKRARKPATRLAGGDPSNVPIVHPIRWPGSWHRKGEPRLCEIETADPDREINLEFALKALETEAPPEATAANGKGASGEERVEWENAFGKILSGESYHPTLVSLSASMACWGMPEPAIDNVLRCLLLNSHPTDPERERRRHAELGKLPETVRSAYAKFAKPEEKPEQRRLHWHDDVSGPRVRIWLVNGLLPQTGVGLISGQWGTYKTFVALDLSAAVMAGLAFIDYPITRNGGVLFIAAEGANEIPDRLRAVLKAKYPERRDALPFAWVDECPRLLSAGAVNELTNLAREAAERMQKDFGVPLVLS